jgi:hypothetical protein
MDVTDRADGHALAHPEVSTPVPLAERVSRNVAAGERSVASSRVYEAGDTEVAAPMPVNPTTHAHAWASGTTTGVGMIEIVIDDRGNVESAKALVAPRTLGETIKQTATLQAIMSWHFRPALKDGMPVRYRQLFAP